MSNRSDHDKTPAPHEWAPPSGLPCKLHEHRLDSHSERIGRLEVQSAETGHRLSQGDVSFAEVRKDIHSLTAAVTSLTGAIKWFIGIILGGVILSVLGLVMRPASAGVAPAAHEVHP